VGELAVAFDSAVFGQLVDDGSEPQPPPRLRQTTPSDMDRA